MPKNIEDVIPPSGIQNNPSNIERRSIRDIPIPEGRRKNINLIDEVPPNKTNPLRDVPSPVPPVPRTTPAQPVRQVPQVNVSEYKDFVSPKGKRNLSRKSLSVVAGLAIIILVAALFSLRSGATLTYTPRSSVITFGGDTFTAYKSAGQNESKLLFSVIQLTEDKGTNVAATGGVETSIKASGIIVIYNNFSDTPERLVRNTRFETTDGKIYRVATDIVIPGKHVVNGKTEAGSLEVKVTADKAGAEYNIPLSDFTIPGLKNDPRYQTMYARSKTPMTGGFVGLQKSVSASDQKTASASLEIAIKSELLDKAKAQVPAEYVLLPDLVQVSYSPLPQGTSTNTSVVVNERGSFSGVMFRKADLAGYLAAQKLGSATNTKFILSDLSNLHASLSSNTADLLRAETITFTLTGTTTLVAETDEKALASELAGKQKSDLENLLKNYPSIANADVVLRPFWKSSFPSEATKIKIQKNGE